MATDAVPDALPWSTPPSDLGSASCDWCGRNIYAPALPCSVKPILGIDALLTPPCLGDRCLWEMRTRGLIERRSHSRR